MSTDKTLADVRPGGMVRLGDGPWPEIDAILADAYSAGAEGLPFEGIARRAAVRAAVAALSAQPSPGGQAGPAYEGHTWVSDYVLAGLRERAAMPLQLRNGEVWHWQGDGNDFPESLVCPVIMSAETLRELLAARQPVGEPVGRVRTRVDGGFIAELLPDVADRVSNMAPLYLQQPAQAVDLSAVREAVRKAWQKCAAGESVDLQFGTLLALIDSQAVGNG